MNIVVVWLESPDGEEWSRDFHRGQQDGGVPTRHSQGIFASIKWDHENCNFNELLGDYISCGPATNHFSWTDNIIRTELEKYGMNGIAEGEN